MTDITKSFKPGRSLFWLMIHTCEFEIISANTAIIRYHDLNNVRLFREMKQESGNTLIIFKT